MASESGYDGYTVYFLKDVILDLSDIKELTEQTELGSEYQNWSRDPGTQELSK